MDVSLDLEGANYRLLQLTPKLQESVERDELRFQSNADGSVMLCTADSTHLVRKLKQSNTLMLLRPGPDSFAAFASPSESLETVQVAPKMDWSRFPVLDLKNLPHEFHELNAETHAPLAPCSFAEFAEFCRLKPALASKSDVFVVHPETVHAVLVELVAAMIESGDFELSEAIPPSSALKNAPQFPAELLRACHLMFAERADSPVINKEKLSTWTAVYILQQHPAGMPLVEFKREWALDLPAKLPVDLGLLSGFVAYPTETSIKFVDIDTLPHDIVARINHLFTAIKPEWTLTEIKPFILPLMPVGQRLENWILKFARKRKAGDDFVISRLRK